MSPSQLGQQRGAPVSLGKPRRRFVCTSRFHKSRCERKIEAFTDHESAIMGSIITLAVPAYLFLQLWATLRLGGGWRLASLPPLLIAIPISLWCVHALADRSNIWPLTFILFAPFGAIYLIVVLALFRLSRVNRV